jgi:hypothetical protein
VGVGLLTWSDKGVIALGDSIVVSNGAEIFSHGEAKSVNRLFRGFSLVEDDKGRCGWGLIERRPIHRFASNAKNEHLQNVSLVLKGGNMDSKAICSTSCTR